MDTGAARTDLSVCYLGQDSEGDGGDGHGEQCADRHDPKLVLCPTVIEGSRTLSPAFNRSAATKFRPAAISVCAPKARWSG